MFARNYSLYLCVTFSFFFFLDLPYTSITPFTHLVQTDTSILNIGILKRLIYSRIHCSWLTLMHATSSFLFCVWLSCTLSVSLSLSLNEFRFMRPTRHYTVFLCEDSSGDEQSQDDDFISAFPDHFLLSTPFEWSIV